MNYNWGAVRREKAIDIGQPGVCLVARAEARDGDEEDLAEELQALAEDIRADEPNCVSYAVTRAMGSRTHFVVHARFTDWRAFRRHAVTPHMKRAMPALMARLDSTLSLEIFFEI